MSEDLVAGGDVLQDRYRLLDRLGTGGMASVWRATDEVLGRTVAVKVLDGRSLEDDQSKARLRAEAKILARLNHPRIASVYDFGLVDGIPYLVMELVEGRTLSALTADEAGLPWPLAVEICAQVAQALDAAHEHGLVHRDVSPSNILWTRSGVKVIDCGLCASTGDPEETEGLLGTPAYMAPERIDGESVRPESDVYALGVVLYRALANHLPWPTESIVQLLGAHRNLPPLPLTVAGLPPAVAAICERCMAKDPADRPTAAELAATLSEALASQSQPVMAAKADPAEVNTVAFLPQRHRRPRPAALVVSAVGLVALTGVATTWFSHSTPPPREASAADQIVAAPADCHVDYRLTKDTGKGFAATITVKNTGDQAYADWRLRFGLPGEQTLDPAQARQWTDEAGVVSSVPQPAELAPGSEVELGFGGRYTDVNPFPTTFLLDDHRCSTSLVGMSGQPAVPVTVVAPNPHSASDQGDQGNDGKARGHKGRGKGD